MYQKVVLENGTRIAVEEMPGVRSVSIGIWVGTGSRYESPDEAGISHLIEHMAFKGTARRSAKQIAEALESVGGQMNAFTSKEYTCFYARVVDEHLPIAIDVLSDMFFSSLYKADDIDREKKVIQEEIRMYEDTPDDLIHDLFAQTVWSGHPLGRPVIGTMDSVAGLSREAVLDYHQRQYCPGNLVLALAGNLTTDAAVSALRPLFEGAGAVSPDRQIQAPETRVANKSIAKPLEQVHFCLGAPGLSQHDDRVYTLQVINTILGGGASSRLFQKIREERGLVYSIYSYFTAFNDAGLFTIYAGTNAENLGEVLELTWREIEQLMESGITPEELARVKEQIKGSLLLASESVTHRMHRLGKSEIIYGRLISPEEVLQKTSAVTREDVLSLVRELLAPERLSITTVGAINGATERLPWSRSTGS
jgi:predicted Zn-dependent peptidase